MKSGPSNQAEAYDWLFFVGSEFERDVRAWHAGGRRGPNSLGSVAVPYEARQVAPGDRLFVLTVTFRGTRMTLLGRLEAGSVRTIYHDTRKTALIVAKRGTATRSEPSDLPRSVVDRLVFEHADGTPHHVHRQSDGTISPSQFAGSTSNLRVVLPGGARLLERRLASAAT